MGATAEAPGDAPVVVISPGRGPAALGRGRLVLEDGATIELGESPPPDLPLGYHRFEPSLTRCRGHHGDRQPWHCWFPEDLQLWGWAAQLYATRSTSQLGHGRPGRPPPAWALGRQSRGRASLINPLHAVLPPLSRNQARTHASSRCFRNPLYLRIEELPGAGDLPGLDQLAQAGRALNQARRIDRDAVWRLKSEALRGPVRPVQRRRRASTGTGTRKGPIWRATPRSAPSGSATGTRGGRWPDVDPPARRPRHRRLRGDERGSAADPLPRLAAVAAR